MFQDLEVLFVPSCPFSLNGWDTEINHCAQNFLILLDVQNPQRDISKVPNYQTLERKMQRNHSPVTMT